MTLKIVGIILILLIVIIYIAMYIIRRNHYKSIDELDSKKSIVMDYFPADKIQAINDKSMAGQSRETAEELKKQWDQIETKQFPTIESLLFEAEQATDRYRFKKARYHEEQAESKISEIKNDLNNLNAALDELMQREEANLKKIESIKKRYHMIRKDLLAKSFSFGKAVDALEDKLGTMETDFSTFSHLTAAGDHEEANLLLKQLEKTIASMEKYMTDIPKILKKMDNEILEQIEELESGYRSLLEEGYRFPDDSIKEEIAQAYVKLESVNSFLGSLEVEKAEEMIKELEDKIEQVYDNLEVEIKAKTEVKELVIQIRKIFHYLKEQNRKLFIEIDRLSQSYLLYRDEINEATQTQEIIAEQEKQYMKINEELAEENMPFSEASQLLNAIFDHLQEMNEKTNITSQHLSDYRKSEIEIKQDLEEMEIAMREMKRYVESRHLPGLPSEYLEFFFYTTDHIEQLSQSLAKPKLDMTEVFTLHELCEEDVEQLAHDTDEIVDQAMLSELVSQRLYRYKSEHSEVIETIKYSRSLFSEDFDYQTSLQMVRDKLESIEPGAFEEVQKQYRKEKNFS